MTELFRNILEASLHGGIVIAVVLLARLALKKVPKKYICLLWLLAALRLLLPFEIESGLSLQPELGTVAVPGSEYAQQVTTGFDSGVGESLQPSVTVPDAGKTEQNVTVDLGENAVVYEREVPLRVRLLENYDLIAAWVWLTVAVGMLGYSVVSYLRLRRRVRDAVVLSEGVWVSGRIDSPFVMGFFRPRIYLNPGLGEGEREYVLAHERCHIRRLDHWWKWLGFVTLAIHWFNPLVWLGYVLLCRDLEMACDEAVVRDMAVGERKAYSAALLACSAKGRTIAACPVAFGEVSVKRRIINVLNYRKPKFWLILAAAVAVAVIAVCFLTSPVKHSVLEFAGVSAEEVTGMMMTNGMGIASVSGKEAADALDILKAVRYDPEIDAFLAPPSETGELHRIDIQCGTEYVTVCFTPDFDVVYREDYSEVRFVRNPERLESLFRELYNGVTHRETSGEPFATAADAYAWANGIRLDAVEEAEFTRYRYIEDHSKTTRGMLREPGFLELLEVLNDLPENAFMESPALNGKDIVRADAFDFDYDGALTFDLTSVTIHDGVNGLVAVLRYYVDIYGEEKLELIITDDLESFENSKYLNNVHGWSVTDEALLEFMREMAEAPPIIRYWDGYWSGIEPEGPGEPKDGWTQTHWGTTAYCNHISPTGLTFAFDQTDTTVTGDLFYGQDFALERWDGTDWVPMPPVIDNGSFTTEALLLSKGTTTFLSIDWEWLYGELPEGYYCLSKTLIRESESRVFRVYFGLYGEGAVWLGSYSDDIFWPVNTEAEETMIAAVAGKTFVYEKGGLGSDFTITLNEDGSFTYYEGLASSYIGMGAWVVDGNTLILADSGLTNKTRMYYFTISNNCLVFQQVRSNRFTYVEVAGGDRFFVQVNEPEQDFYEELFTRRTDGAYTTMWIADLYEAFYAEPEEFTRQMTRINIPVVCFPKI